MSGCRNIKFIISMGLNSGISIYLYITYILYTYQSYVYSFSFGFFSYSCQFNWRKSFRFRNSFLKALIILPIQFRQRIYNGLIILILFDLWITSRSYKIFLQTKSLERRVDKSHIYNVYFDTHIWSEIFFIENS